MDTHWSRMSLQQRVSLLKDLKKVIASVPVEKLNMDEYIHPVDGGPDEVTPETWHDCGSAFCMLGWVASFRKFATAFNIAPGADRFLNTRVQYDLHPWYLIDELYRLFNPATFADPGTEELKDEVLGRIDRAIEDLNLQINIERQDRIMDEQCRLLAELQVNR